MPRLATSAALAALLAISAPAVSSAAQPAQVAAQVAPVEAPARFKIGALDAVALLDGTMTVPNNGKIFGVGRPTSDVAATLQAAGLQADQLHLSLQPLLVRSGDRTLLFDAGMGEGVTPTTGRLQSALSAAGASAGQVTDIFISHAHGDHVGGLLTPAGALAFPNAAIRMSAPEWAALQADARQARLVTAITPKVATFAPGAVVLPGLVTAVPVTGHTPGHSAYEIASGAERLLYIGDSAHHHVISVRQPNWTIQFDRDAPTAEASRRALLQRAADQNLRLYAIHFPYPGVGRVKPQGDGFVWVSEGR
ncbi:MBL fold metallo-hydrolase [Phenylobacterium deserti]|uniref:MBL fold metallo-hydrolase n=1 Tax=Phenylobacterium deserti TaxID=1914756 RepID=A0A328A9Q6_9CAUL|nr:MBL fold metallo-hydrolase [Phenylobacterium deserti]RAK51443.1 MBL fold metallo-hydrolase [Phenylobacterium deserti]